MVTESGPGGGCWLLDGYRFPLRGLSGDEAAALLVLGVPTAVAELGLADALAAAQHKIRITAGAGVGRDAGGASGGADRGPASALVHLDMPRWFGGSEPVPSLRTLAAAVRDRQQLRIGYRHGDQKDETSRVVCPFGLVNKAGTSSRQHVNCSSTTERMSEPASRCVNRRPVAAYHSRSPSRRACRIDVCE